MENLSDELGLALQQMQDSLKGISEEHSERIWLQTGKNILIEKLRGDKTLVEISKEIIDFLADYSVAQIGTVYVYEETVLNLQYAYGIKGKITNSFQLGEGLVGQVALEKSLRIYNKLPKNYFKIESSLGTEKPDAIAILPAIFDNKIIAVIELGRFGDFSPIQLKLLNEIAEPAAVILNSAISRKMLEKLLTKLTWKEQELNNQINAINKTNAFIEFDLSGTILTANEIFLSLIGYSINEIVGKHHSIFVEKEYAATKEYRQFWDDLKKGEFQEGEYKRIQKNGESIWLLGSYNPILDVAGKPYKILKIARDVTLVKNQAKQLAKLATEKEKRSAELVMANNELATQAGVLQMQQEEMKQMNEELEEQTQNLKQQQEELQMTNEELEEQTQSFEMKNKELEGARYNIEQKTKQLEISSRYKSEFLANMSHELRTPLNSLLILSKDLSENKRKNLDMEQVQSAEIIYNSGQDLLILINEVLDLSKIEAGKMSINIERVSLKNFVDNLLHEFKHHAEQKGLLLSRKVDNNLPESIATDSQRLNQILKNLLSNAIKFTEKGSVNISIGRYTESSVIISVTDTGIGIHEDNQTAIFEAFHQADGGISRKYGGTGLGLSISRELAKLLGVEIRLKSKLNEGTTFSLIIPIELQPEYGTVITNILQEPVLHKSRTESNTAYLNYPAVNDDREIINTDDTVVLIIEDDLKFASILLKQANKKGFKALSAASGEDGLILATKHLPQAIILDLDLPGIKGEQVLSELKENPILRHIPVHVVSVNERSMDIIREGAIEYLVKPVSKKQLDDTLNRIENFLSRKMKNLLIIEDDENSRKAMRKVIGNGDVKYFEARAGKEALTIFQQHHIDCIVLDIGLPDMSGIDLIYKLESLTGNKIPPIIIYTGKELTKEENSELEKYAASIIIKGVKSEERLLDETALFLHRAISSMPEAKQLVINNLYDKEAIFHAKKILLVDDDMRNVFALSKILRDHGMEIIKSENGKIALEMLNIHPDIDLVLMDIMMPEMDGYEAMKQIRVKQKFKNLPVIALTAKAMKDDKQKCINAGANDYINKPVDTERLLSLMRVWLSK
ncbi:PAS domain S-box-containing protein [Chitinophaga sp. CF118]|uniref:response regulator n=1 Tax=Chitinophaga sp. CF118 TaxID=1884367 RepID=UPI0008E9877D|nr:response regulator [Chitinophaga sp. CF118]SFD88268.1 PAS domain S-box-containing protein [Chitinophaga sp. CF118]